MRPFLSALCIAIALLASAPAQAANESRAFPPDNCTTGSPFMGFTGVAGSNTFCNSGQDILTNALPTCTDGQQVVKENGKFICKTAANVPSCNPNEFLNFDGQTYTCKSTGVATCGNNQVLTFNGSSYYCVNKDAAIPNCAANQFLTYNGSYQCAAVNNPVVPNCGPNQTVTANGSTFYCADTPLPPSAVYAQSTPDYIGAAAYNAMIEAAIVEEKGTPADADNLRAGCKWNTDPVDSTRYGDTTHNINCQIAACMAAFHKYPVLYSIQGNCGPNSPPGTSCNAAYGDQPDYIVSCFFHGGP